MDSITHTVIGACLGEVIAGKKLGKKAMLIGALANNLPDIDVITTFWTSPAKELLVHRGITHSILFAVIASYLLALAFKKLIKNEEVSLKQWLLLIGSGLFLHILIDAFTAYGTGWFEPFSHYRVSFNTLFILDPFLSLPMIVASVALLIVKRDAEQKRKRIALFGLYLSLFYLTICTCIKLYVNKTIEQDLKSKNISYQSYLATPTPMNNILWYTVAKSGSGFYIGYYSILDKNPTLTWEFFEKNDSLLQPFKNNQEIECLTRFSKNYYCVREKGGSLNFSDIRFGQIGGWYAPQAPFVFNFDLTLQKNNKINLQQGRFKSINKKDFELLISRIKGIEN
ncbi:metal-dependent hydrolase [Aurantibacillus circumpalustris]|uniref:metal-dependent hydrolase n=1 Tax=Aurantibacillus circumpalustris TaxID=3036359 RepID=UPI00295A8664|nr:metal-dependent hydrolase [Aurantibacillus circumpalustris]